jgi:hypothetical protein
MSETNSLFITSSYIGNPATVSSSSSANIFYSAGDTIGLATQRNPASGAAGFQGEMCYGVPGATGTTGYIYCCLSGTGATGATWGRAALTTGY